MASMSVQASAAGYAAVSRQYPEMDMSNPAESFFKLIRTGKYQDGDTEYGAKTVAREYGAIPQALKAECDDPTFPGQMVAERQIETLLNEVENPDRFKMARQIVLTMRDRDRVTLFANMAEITCYLASSNPDAKMMIESLLKEDGVWEFAADLVAKYEAKPALAVVFSNLLANMKRVGGVEVDEAAAAVDELELSGHGDESEAPAATDPLLIKDKLA